MLYKINNMKKIIILLTLSIIIISCKKKDKIIINTNPIENPTIPNNNLFGTKWVLTKYLDDTTYTVKNDTILFIDNYTYKLNNNLNIFQYSTNVTINDSTKQKLILYNFKPIINYNLMGTISSNIKDSIRMDSIRFKDLNVNNSNSKKFFLWFKRII